MTINKHTGLLLIILTTCLLAGTDLSGQTVYSFKDPERDKIVLPCEMSQNLFIIPARINNSTNLKLVLDSGIGNTIITGLTPGDTVTMKEANKIRVGGLGDGTPVEAYYSQDNQIDIELPDDMSIGITGKGMDIYLMTTDQFELSRQLGLKVNGLIGSDLFQRYLIGFDAIDRKVTFYQRENLNYRRLQRRYTKIPLIISNGRAFIDVRLIQENNTPVTVRLLVDTGASLAFWIAQFSDPSLIIPSKTMRSLLGQGLSGTITGVNGRVKEARIGKYSFKNPLVSFPDSACVAGLSLGPERHGSMGNDILRRFNVIFDFRDSALYLEPNKWYKSAFSYNRSGMDVEKMNPLLPVYTIFNIIPGSPADKAGLKPGDIIEYINYQPAFTLTLDDINSVLYGENGKFVLIRVDREGEKIKVRFQLQDKV